MQNDLKEIKGSLFDLNEKMKVISDKINAFLETQVNRQQPAVINGSQSVRRNAEAKIQEEVRHSGVQVAVEECNNTFRALDHNDVSNFGKLIQNTTVAEYQVRFERLMALLLSTNKALSEKYFIDCFIDGLNEKIKHTVQRFTPKSLKDAINLAKLRELIMRPVTNDSQSVSSSSVSSQFSAGSSTIPPSNRNSNGHDGSIVHGALPNPPSSCNNNVKTALSSEASSYTEVYLGLVLSIDCCGKDEVQATKQPSLGCEYGRSLIAKDFPSVGSSVFSTYSGYKGSIDQSLTTKVLVSRMNWGVFSEAIRHSYTEEVHENVVNDFNKLQQQTSVVENPEKIVELNDLPTQGHFCKKRQFHLLFGEDFGVGEYHTDTAVKEDSVMEVKDQDIANGAIFLKASSDTLKNLEGNVIFALRIWVTVFDRGKVLNGAPCPKFEWIFQGLMFCSKVYGLTAKETHWLGVITSKDVVVLDWNMGACLFGLELPKSRVAALVIAGSSLVFLICFAVHYWYLEQCIRYDVVAFVPLGVVVDCHLSVTNPFDARRDALQSSVIRPREGFRRKGQNSGSSSHADCGSSGQLSSSIEDLTLCTEPISRSTTHGACEVYSWKHSLLSGTASSHEGINSDMSIDIARPSLAMHSSSCRFVQETEVGVALADKHFDHDSSLMVSSRGGLEIQGCESSTSILINQLTRDSNLACVFQEILNDPRLTSMLKWQESQGDVGQTTLSMHHGILNLSCTLALEVHRLTENGLVTMVFSILQMLSWRMIHHCYKVLRKRESCSSEAHQQLRNFLTSILMGMVLN